MIASKYNYVWKKIFNIFKNIQIIKHVKFYVQYFNTQMEDSSLESFVDYYMKCISLSQLESLIFYGHYFTHKSIHKLLNAINLIDKLEYLNLRFSLAPYENPEEDSDSDDIIVMNSSDIICLIEGLMKNKSLKMVDFRNGDYLMPFNPDIFASLKDLSIKNNNLVALLLPEIDQKDLSIVSNLKRDLERKWYSNRLQSSDVLDIIRDMLAQQNEKSIFDVLNIVLNIKNPQLQKEAEMEIAYYILNQTCENETAQQKENRLIHALACVTGLFTCDDSFYDIVKKLFLELLNIKVFDIKSNFTWAEIFRMNPSKARIISTKILAIDMSKRNANRSLANFFLDYESTMTEQSLLDETSKSPIRFFSDISTAVSSSQAPESLNDSCTQPNKMDI